MIYDYYKIIFSTKDKMREATKVNETPNGSQNVLQKFMKIFCEVSAAGCDANSCLPCNRAKHSDQKSIIVKCRKNLQQ